MRIEALGNRMIVCLISCRIRQTLAGYELISDCFINRGFWATVFANSVRLGVTRAKKERSFQENEEKNVRVFYDCRHGNRLSYERLFREQAFS